MVTLALKVYQNGPATPMLARLDMIPGRSITGAAVDAAFEGSTFHIASGGTSRVPNLPGSADYTVGVRRLEIDLVTREPTDNPTRWFRHITDGLGDDVLADVAINSSTVEPQTLEGVVWVTGKSQDGPNGDFDILTYQLNDLDGLGGLGDTRWLAKWNSPANGDDEDVRLDPLVLTGQPMRLYVTGATTGVQGERRVVTLKYDTVALLPPALKAPLWSPVPIRLRPGNLHSEPAGIDVHWVPNTTTRHFNIGGRSLSPTSGWDWQTLGYTDNTP
ncbi:MAG: hypothetical protein KF678_13495 [Phycisphaeraceae bacterium]|nr:hypothetical protein [Phycisphaeraceae bacterium]